MTSPISPWQKPTCTNTLAAASSHSEPPAHTKPAPPAAHTKPAPSASACTKPAPSAAHTKPAPPAAHTKPAPSASACTKSAPSAAHTKPAPPAAHTKPAPSASACTKPAPSASACTKPAPSAAHTKPAPPALTKPTPSASAHSTSASDLTESPTRAPEKSSSSQCNKETSLSPSSPSKLKQFFESYATSNQPKRETIRRSLRKIKKDIVIERSRLFSSEDSGLAMSQKPSYPTPERPVSRGPKPTPAVRRVTASKGADSTSNASTADSAKPQSVKPDRPPPPSAALKPKINNLKRSSAVDASETSSTNSSQSVADRSKIFSKPSSAGPPRPPNPPSPANTLTRAGSQPKSPLSQLQADTNQKDVLKKSVGDKSRNAYDGVVVLNVESFRPAQVAIDTKTCDDGNILPKQLPTPPAKPPRTFAHDEYIQIKAEKRENRTKRKPLQTAGALRNVYEEVDVENDRVTIIDESDKRHSAEKIKQKVDFVLPGGKLPLPPRPPRPLSAEEQSPDNNVVNPFKDQSIVKVTKHNKSLGKDNFVKRSKISNPSYAKETDIIPIKSAESLKRCKSDEYLYVEELRDRTIPIEPIYQDPADAVRPWALTCTVTPHGVCIDTEGYAIPDTRSHTLNRQLSIPGMRLHRAYGTLAHGERVLNGESTQQPRLNRVKTKVNTAYSILRRKRQNGSDETDTTHATQDVSDDSDTEVDERRHRKRLEYVTSVKNKTYEQVQIYSQSIAPRTFKKLFDYALIVGLERLENSQEYQPKVLFRFPDDVKEDMNTISAFCFPDASVWRPVTKCLSETFTFVLTHEDGMRRYGYCRRILPAGCGNRLPEVYCVVSSLGIPPLFEQLLSDAEHKREFGIAAVENLLKAAFSKPLPRPGGEIRIRSPGHHDKMETLNLKRPLDMKANAVKYGKLLSLLPLNVLLKVYSSLLLERRVIFSAQHLSTLSRCIQSIHCLLYPFTWQHTFVPVLPSKMIEVVCAPTPYVIGVLTSLQPKIQALNVEEAVIVDLDRGSILTCQGDEGDIIPPKIQRALTAAVREDQDTLGSRDAVVPEAFIRLFVETVGHYSEFICTQQDGNRIFQKEAFVKAVSSRSIRMFLEWFSETQMFEVFISNKLLDRPTDSGLFDERVQEYREELLMANSFRQNVKQVGRKMKNFLIESGDKLKKKFGASESVEV